MTMILLALDSTTDASSAAVWRDGVICAKDVVHSKYGHAERLVSQAKQVLSEADVSVLQLSAIIGGRGPGSFTGIRTCLSAVTGFGIVADVPCYGVNKIIVII